MPRPAWLVCSLCFVPSCSVSLHVSQPLATLSGSASPSPDQQLTHPGAPLCLPPAETGKLLVRDNAIILSIEHVRLIITADKASLRGGWDGQRWGRTAGGRLDSRRVHPPQSRRVCFHDRMATRSRESMAVWQPAAVANACSAGSHPAAQVLIPREGYEHNPLR